jgi:signal transduction histidine kinase
MKKETKIEIFFWILALFVFSPRIILEFQEHKFKNSLIPFENDYWVIKDKVGNILYEKISLPLDLRWKEQKSGRHDWIFEKEIKTEKLNHILGLGIVLGRIGDNDTTYFNECLIGSNPNQYSTSRWSWSQLRRYYVPSSCITPTSKIQVHVQKVVASGYGIYAGPIGFGSMDQIEYQANVLDVIRYGVVLSFGLGLVFFVAIHYFFINIIAQKREIYGVFSFLAFSIGIFLILISTYPFRLFGPSIWLFKFLFLSAVGSSWGFLDVYRYKFGVHRNITLKIYKIVVCAIFLLFAMIQVDAGKVYAIYEIWFPIFLLAFLVFFAQILFKKNEDRKIYFSKYKISYVIFVICCLHDVYLTFMGLPNAHIIPYGFVFFVLVIALSLSQEYSDAFEKTEDQVIQRTQQLNIALESVQNIQKLKDEQAKRFAHDIRSPLAALKVLKDIISPSVPEDQGTLLKHAIVRINDLANTVLPKLVDGNRVLTNEVTPVFLWPVVDKIISEKKIEFKHIGDFAIDVNSHSNIFDLCVMCNETEMARVLSNLINNSIQARQENQTLKIELQIELSGHEVAIILKDNGKGISEEHVVKVFDKGFTFGKSGGMGIGLSSSRQLIESWKGKIFLQSQKEVGTVVTISLPKAIQPDWLLTKLNLKNIDQIVVIDDQPFVTETWKQKLQGIALSERITWIQNIKDWIQWYGGNKIQNVMFLVDYDLGSSLQGLDIISKYALLPNAALITGHDDDSEVRANAETIGVKILPKSLH